MATMERLTRWEPILLGKARTFEEIEAEERAAYEYWCKKQGYYDRVIVPHKMSFEEWVVEYIETWRKPREVDWFDDWIRMGEKC